MRTRTTAAALITASLLALTACSNEYTADDCAAAITDTSTKTNRPIECQDISDEDYETLILGHILKNDGILPTE
ncbi:hypothetical protein CP967_08590 [Streptomyces nitrosporeus]|uniref:Uncharacterized protein n=1 Tax=Streptomyces nitrosporeus TaxID=28894 RepID=A0A5J6F6R9_9ACTN|nr:hypothetical protein [Streptomyces nitrosporeus]QEU72019.1 hypothetical protein CP967_08590 [Streptomyces nitrosporeus]GGY81230.1 hypothetical protein GCM10010327_09830 [Streptomyces nitrosporeus]